MDFFQLSNPRRIINMIEKLRELEELGLVRCFKHNTLPLLGWNYTQTVQFEKSWGEHPILRQCRGLITDTEGNIIARGFEKFFNWEEHGEGELPCKGDKIEITEKLDGSLIIAFRYAEQVVYTTRGSFYSDQAQAASVLYNTLYNEDWIEERKSYLFEYIAPENRIVVAYSRPDLIHLAVLDINGVDLPRDSKYHLVPVHEFSDTFSDELYDFLRQQPDLNREGFVIRQVLEGQPNFRVKIKYESYCALHRLVTNTSNMDVWDSMRLGGNLDNVLSNVPDEFFNWVSSVKAEIESDFADLQAKAQRAYDNVKGLGSRKEQAQALFASEDAPAAHAVFLMLDGKDHTQMLWKLVKPEKRELPSYKADPL